MISAARKRGFTLVELMIVVAIMMVVTAIAMPSIITSVSSYRLRSSASGLAGAFQKTRMQAVSDDRWYPMAMVTAGGQTYVFGDLSTPPNGTLDPGKETQLISYLPRGTAIDNAGAPPNTSMNLEFTPTTGLPAFNARGLPCTITGGTCRPQTATGGAEGWSGYICYLRQARPLGGASWAAITVSPAGRIRVWSWNGAAWK